MQYESVQTPDVLNFENVEAVGSCKELFVCHLMLSVMLQRTGNNRQEMFPQSSANAMKDSNQ